MRITVVGAGIAGSSVTRAARTAGHDVTLVSSGDTASSVGLVVIRTRWHQGPDHADARRSLQLYRDWRVPVVHGAAVTSWRSSTTPQIEADWHALHPEAPLVTPDSHVRALAVGPGRVLTEGDGDLRSDVVFDCRGNGDGMRRTYGATLVCADLTVLNSMTACRVHHLRPYYSGMAMRVGGDLRVGSSLSRTLDGAVDGVRDMRQALEQLGILRRDAVWRIDAGIRARPMVEGDDPVNASPGLVRYRGLHRTGYALAPAVAERLVRDL